MANQNQWCVAKFGGTSVIDLSVWQNIAAITQAHLANNHRVLIVCSAPSQVSNHLETLIQEALRGNHQETFATIQKKYLSLVEALNVNFAEIAADFSMLQQLCDGIFLLKEATPRTHAQVLSFGELMLTKLGFHYLQQQAINIVWQDARKLLSANTNPSNETAYLSATCDFDYDEKLVNHLNQLGTSVVITQGFIASNHNDETVLLGRGGSDTSAAYFAAKLAAKCCEIWTDVPGIYTANPHQIPEAKLLKMLDYAEVQEIASLGAKVLHPNCIPPLSEKGIPLYVKYTKEPKRPGTLVSLESEVDTIPIKAIITNFHVFLISIDSVKMWKQSGFLADIFSLFKNHHLSVDLISTSESNITVSLDPIANRHAGKTIELLLADLNRLASAKLIGPCASVSLIGRHMRAILPQISQLFEVFASQKIYLLSQAANDLNLTFVVDEDQAPRLAKKLHVLLVEQNPKSHFIGKSWLEEYGDYQAPTVPWWEMQREILLSQGEKHSPVYIYDAQTLAQQADAMLQCNYIDHIFYAVKANPYPDILKLFHKKDLNFECVSLGEVECILNLFPDIDRKRILFTPNFAPRIEYEAALTLNINLTVDSLSPLEHWPSLFKGKEIIIRVDPGAGSGHHKYVCTGGTESKFGIAKIDLHKVAALANAHQIKIIGLHAHSGSGILQTEIWQETAKTLTSFLEIFPDIKIIDVGGGLGVVEKPGQNPLDLAKVNHSLKVIKTAYPHLQIWMEPGRFLVANAGILLAKVTQVKQKNNVHYVGIETGMNSIIRPALYGSYHEIINLTKLHQPKTMIANIVGPICESGDTLGYSRMLPETEEGDILLINTVGAYGHCMSSHYNLREPASELLL